MPDPKKGEADGKIPPKTFEHHESREKEIMGAGYGIHERAEDKSWRKDPIKAPKLAIKSHGYGHSAIQRNGHYRNSGHPSAHRIGKRGS